MAQNGTAYVYLVFQVLNGFISIGNFYMYISAVSSFTNAMREVLSRLVAIRQFQPYYTIRLREASFLTALIFGNLTMSSICRFTLSCFRILPVCLFPQRKRGSGTGRRNR
ncbi:MAG: hypothetical protein LBD79_08190 [Treponema sp.]|nr:hypothetical protein [Treponema sp.]